jgi:hypothetical protein
MGIDGLLRYARNDRGGGKGEGFVLRGGCALLRQAQGRLFTKGRGNGLLRPDYIGTRNDREGKGEGGNRRKVRGY